jgi:GH15 family glucan-1,4-alpha-glucosidase
MVCYRVRVRWLSLLICAACVVTWTFIAHDTCNAAPSAVADSARAPVHPPVHSHDTLPSSNGRVVLVYDAGKRAVTSLRDHVYKQVSADVAAQDLLTEALFGLSGAQGTEHAASVQTPIESVGYVPGTGIVRAVQTAGRGRIETFYAAPFHPRDGGRPFPIAFLLAHVTNLSSSPMNETSVWLRVRSPANLQHVTLGVVPVPATQRTGPDAHTVVHVWSVGTLAPGADVWVGAILAVAAEGDTSATRAAERAASVASPRDLVDAERADWDAWHAIEKPPPNLSAERMALYRQSTAVLRMAQCTEPGASEGQIVASLPPGGWNITWLRDGCYAIAALVASGHHEEARRGLEFFRRAKVGAYRTFIRAGHDYGVGMPYALSVCRYYGNGEEESDSNAAGPNIELDGFGLFPWAASLYVQSSGDTAWAREAWPWLVDGVLRVIPSLVDQTSHVIREDSSIWERHVAPPSGPDGAKHFAWTTIACARGLRAAVALARAAGHAGDGVYLASQAAALAEGFRARFITDDKRVLGSLEKPADSALDASAVEAVCAGLVAPNGPEFARLLGECDARLRTPVGRGYKRNLDGTWYDEQEWVFVDLRLARALTLAGNAKRADELIDWVTAQSALNHNLIAELYEAASARYAGATPMAGYGAGAYILALHPEFDRPTRRPPASEATR